MRLQFDGREGIRLMLQHLVVLSPWNHLCHGWELARAKRRVDRFEHFVEVLAVKPAINKITMLPMPPNSHVIDVEHWTLLDHSLEVQHREDIVGLGWGSCCLVGLLRDQVSAHLIWHLLVALPLSCPSSSPAQLVNSMRADKEVGRSILWWFLRRGRQRGFHAWSSNLRVWVGD